VALERQLLEMAHRYSIRLIGPNCLGIMRPAIGLNATFILEKAVHHEGHREHEGKRTDFINVRNHPSGGAENPRMFLQLRGLCGELNCRF